jgi:hypothetical protein
VADNQNIIVRDVTVRSVVVPLRRPLATKVGDFSRWPLLLIDVTTEQGLTGRGYLAPYLSRASAALRTMLGDMGAELRGQPASPANAYRAARGWLGLAGYQGLALAAVAGLDIALWDVLAQAAGLPLAVLLGGKDNFAADRIAGEETIAAYPAIRASARANRAFLARSVRYLAAEAGIRQFLDIGTGLPTASNTHEVAQSVAPESRIVYVDNDPLVLAHARALLTSSREGATAYLAADLRDVDAILEQAAGTLDLTQPVGVMLLAILHYIPDLDQARRIMTRLVGALPSGSFVTISHAASDISPEAMAEMIKRMNQHLAEANHVGRTRDVVAGFFDGLDLLEPGVVKVTQWRPASDIEAGGPTSLWGGVGRKPLPAWSPDPAAPR